MSREFDYSEILPVCQLIEGEHYPVQTLVYLWPWVESNWTSISKVHCSRQQYAASGVPGGLTPKSSFNKGITASARSTCSHRTRSLACPVQKAFDGRLHKQASLSQRPLRKSRTGTFAAAWWSGAEPANITEIRRIYCSLPPGGAPFSCLPLVPTAPQIRTKLTY